MGTATVRLLKHLPASTFYLALHRCDIVCYNKVIYGSFFVCCRSISEISHLGWQRGKRSLDGRFLTQPLFAGYDPIKKHFCSTSFP